MPLEPSTSPAARSFQPAISTPAEGYVAEEPTPTGVRPSAPADAQALRRFLRHGLWFVLIGVLIYAVIYLVSAQAVARSTVRNRFFLIHTAPATRYDHVILGASRAAVFDYADMNAQLEAMTGSKILNLSIVGGGVVPNRLLLDYFLTRHETDHVVYFVDSFAFYSSEWNEDRLQDVALYQRAPIDLNLARLMLAQPSTRAMVPGYLLGFYKINNSEWFKSDISEEEATRFDKSYRPIPQIDRQRMEYLYPGPVEPATYQRYLSEFEELLRELTAQGIRVTLVKPPLPPRVVEMLPDEARFDADIQQLAQQYGAEFHDFSLVSNDPEFFFNTDHLNQTGVLNFYEHHFKELLAAPAN